MNRPVLTGLETAVLIGIANGEPTRATAERVRMSPSAVQKASSTARRLLGAKTREHMVALAFLTGLITAEDVIGHD